MSDTTVSETRRKEIFSRLVEVQDKGVSVVESRRRVAQEYELEMDDMLGIEREGVSSRWPPL
ncbi:MAG: hypothetical protein R3C59_19520 [Planctomycetaceae bacterium]